VRILFISSGSGSRGGGELYLIFLARALTEQGCRCALWCPEHPRMDELASAFAPLGPVLRSRYTNTYDRRLRSLRYLLPGTAGRTAALRLWRGWQPDLLHLNKQLLEDGLDLLRWAASTGLPRLCTIHITQGSTELGAVAGRLRDWVARHHLLRWRGPLVAIGAARGAALRAQLGSGARVEVIDNGVELPDPSRRADLRAQMRAELGLAGGELLAVAVGRMEAQKEPLRFLDWAAQLRAREPRLRCLWIGDGRLAADWDRACARRGLAGCVERLPWQATVEPWLAAADLFLHPAAFEGLPFALLEAMAWELPVVVQPALAAELDFLDDRTALIADPAEAWIADALDPARRAQLAQAGRAVVAARFSRQRMAERYRRLYAAIAGCAGERG
jgi:glycosyltransferase involved in cell wall biosynthesis